MLFWRPGTRDGPWHGSFSDQADARNEKGNAMRGDVTFKSYTRIFLDTNGEDSRHGILDSRDRRLPEDESSNMSKQKKCASMVGRIKIGVTERVVASGLLLCETLKRVPAHGRQNSQGPFGQRVGTYAGRHQLFFLVDHAKYLETATALFRVLPRIVIPKACLFF
jgi:hypothetical protein